MDWIDLAQKRAIFGFSRRSQLHEVSAPNIEIHTNTLTLLSH
jgi:hypothetical protein